MIELPSLNTKHLSIYCSSADNDPDSESCPEDEAPWRFPWYICLKNKSSTLVGIFRFDGPPVNGRVLLQVDEDKSYIDSSYAAEALDEICDWIFSQKDAVAVKVHHIPNNESYYNLLTMCGFIIDEEDKTVAEKKKSPSIWKTSFMGTGLCLGMSLAFLFNPDKAFIGILPGILIGFIVGAVFDGIEAKHIEDILYGDKYPQKSDKDGNYKE